MDSVTHVRRVNLSLFFFAMSVGLGKTNVERHGPAQRRASLSD